ncbi:MAG: hypothetical protein B7Y84_05905 [Azorhizobium sp. 32-67-21]|nr:MAG: hypothetical protein B7Y84_05905 [Azorhizobium sp. 32-67-21]
MRWAGGNPRPGAGVPFQEGGPGLRREAQTRQLDHRPRRQPMDPFIQMLRAAQGGQGLNNLAQLYGLSVQQAQIAAEALMPAFAAGLQKRMGSPEGLANIMVLMMRGPYGALYDQRPNSPADFMQPGTNALQALFGSDEVNRAVMNHAAATTGLGTAVMNQMAPGFASLLMGGLTKSLAASGALNQMLAGFMARANGRPEPTGNPWVDALAAMTSSQSMGRGTGNPWIDAFADMMVRSSGRSRTISRSCSPPASRPACVARARASPMTRSACCRWRSSGARCWTAARATPTALRPASGNEKAGRKARRIKRTRAGCGRHGPRGRQRGAQPPIL